MVKHGSAYARGLAATIQKCQAVRRACRTIKFGKLQGAMKAADDQARDTMKQCRHLLMLHCS
jgi:hypothetical protein